NPPRWLAFPQSSDRMPSARQLWRAERAYRGPHPDAVSAGSWILQEFHRCGDDLIGGDGLETGPRVAGVGDPGGVVADEVEAWAARQLGLHDTLAVGALADGAELLGIGWAEDAHGGRAHGGGDVQRTGIVADEEGRQLNQGTRLLERGLPGGNGEVARHLGRD